MTIPMSHGVVHISCGGKPLDESPYLPPASDLAELGRYLARRYGAKAVNEDTLIEQKAAQDNARKGAEEGGQAI